MIVDVIELYDIYTSFMFLFSPNLYQNVHKHPSLPHCDIHNTHLLDPDEVAFGKYSVAFWSLFGSFSVHCRFTFRFSYTIHKF